MGVFFVFFCVSCFVFCFFSCQDRFGDFFVCWMVGYEIFGSGKLTFGFSGWCFWLGARASCPENMFFSRFLSFFVFGQILVISCNKSSKLRF